MLYYISGFVVRKIDKFMKCEECTKRLYNVSQSRADNLYDKFTSLVSRGHLVKASNNVFKVVKFFYSLFLVNKDKSNFCSKQYITQACMYFKGNIFKNHPLNREFI